MITVRKSEHRGHLDHGWLDARHSFSFGRYVDREHMGFRSLRVINEDVIAPGAGFGEHPHNDMEIITYPLSGAIRHTDSLGHAEDITPGIIQRMTAGRGIRHSESNPSPTDPTHMLQIWIEPRAVGLEPSHESRAFDIRADTGRLHLLASPDGVDGSMIIQQDARLYAGVLKAGGSVEVQLAPGRGAWVQVASGSITVNGIGLAGGDGAAIEDETMLRLESTGTGEVLVFDLA